MKWQEIPTPCYVVDEKKLKQNLKILQNLEQETGCHVLLAQKAFSMFSLYPLIGQYISGTTASGIFEARLGKEEMGKENHVFAPAYKEKDMEELVQICDHIIFNSFAQYEKYKEMCRESAKVRKDKKAVSVGIRINPQCSTQEGHEIYDPCGYASRLGVTEEQFREDLLEDVEGLHFHTLCEQNADALEVTMRAVEDKFGDILPRMKWVNLGGGHHITRHDYERSRLEELLLSIKKKWDVQVYLEPGEAVALNAGYLVSRVLDIVKNGETQIAILDASAACHMPDVLEMPYQPPIYNAAKQPDEGGQYQHRYRLAGPTCLAGDVIGDYYFPKELKAGDMVIFGDMAIYTTCKNNTFNGMPLPDIWSLGMQGRLEQVTAFGYQDFKTRLGRK